MSCLSQTACNIILLEVGRTYFDMCIFHSQKIDLEPNMTLGMKLLQIWYTGNMYIFRCNVHSTVNFELKFCVCYEKKYGLSFCTPQSITLD